MTAATPLQVLFVDDESCVLDGLRRQFRSARHEWSMRFATSAREALAELEKHAADVVVSDMRMPERSGASLLREVRDRWPASARFILSGQTDQSELLDDIGVIHQFIQKPCEPRHIHHAVTRTRALLSKIDSDELRTVAASIESLPVVSASYQQLVQALGDESCDAARVAKIVEGDIGLSTKLMQMVNSAFFGLPRSVKTVKQAVVLIGTRNLRTMALTSKIVDALASDNPSAASIARLWRASADIGSMAANFARTNREPESVREAARLAGSLSLIGRAVLARSRPERFASALAPAASGRCTIAEAEHHEFGVAQEMIAAYALGLWAFDDDVVEAVTWQRQPDGSRAESASHPVAYVHLARSFFEDAPIVECVTPADAWLEQVGIDREKLTPDRRAA